MKILNIEEIIKLFENGTFTKTNTPPEIWQLWLTVDKGWEILGLVGDHKNSGIVKQYVDAFDNNFETILEGLYLVIEIREYEYLWLRGEACKLPNVLW